MRFASPTAAVLLALTLFGGEVAAQASDPTEDSPDARAGAGDDGESEGQEPTRDESAPTEAEASPEPPSAEPAPDPPAPEPEPEAAPTPAPRPSAPPTPVVVERAPAGEPPVARAPAAPATPERELVYVIVGREPSGDTRVLMRVIEAALESDSAEARGAAEAALGARAAERPAAPPQETEVDTERAAPLDPAPADSEVPESRDEIGFLPWAVFGAGAAALLGGAITGALVLESRDELRERCVDGICVGEDAEALARTRTLADVTTALFVGGGAAIAGGLLAILIDVLSQDQESEAAGVTPQLGCSLHGCHAGMRVRF